MASEIMLAKPFDLDKIGYPAEVTVKLDGVAADFYKTPNGWVCQSRSGKPLPSTGHLIDFFNKRLHDTEINTHIVGELTVVGVPNFKDAGGIIRRKKTDNRIVLNVYDVYHPNRSFEHYVDRLKNIKELIKRVGLKGMVKDDTVSWSMVVRVPTVRVVSSKQELLRTLEDLPGIMKTSPMCEGFVIRSFRGVDTKYEVNKRRWGMMKYKPKPTLDLPVVGFEEATANKTMTFLNETFEEGQGLRAVGAIKVLYRGNIIPAGPGTLTHAERRDLWERYERIGKPDLSNRGLLAEIEYMLDEAYDKLRQPVFQRWRTDKTEINEDD
jgi:ATP-dependent DNA ligase